MVRLSNKLMALEMGWGNMETIFKISVRNIVEFALKSGDIDSGFASRSVAVEGTKGHKAVQKLRISQEESYLSEVSLVYCITKGDIRLEISGRIDGVFVKDNIIIVEEIKTTERQLDNIEEDYNLLHIAQAKCYAYMYLVQNKLERMGVQLTYYHRNTKELKSFFYIFEFAELENYFNEIVNKYLKWAVIISDWNEKRNVSIGNIKFPFATYRKGQREFAVATYKTICEGKKLFAQAPTGIGKTIATIFPGVKAVGEGRIAKIFYLTAKTSTRNIAEEAYENLRKCGLNFRTVTITAKEKLCPQEKVSCKPEDCIYAKGYYDRIDNAIEDILEFEHFNKSAIIQYSQKHKVCPFELSLDLSLFCDGIICDYNYVFDPRVYLKRFFMDVREDYGFLIDEAHNLVDRAREMYSAELLKSSFLNMKNEIGKEAPEVKKSINEINSYFIKLRKKMEMKNEIHFVTKELLEDINGLIEKFITYSEILLSKGKNYSFRDKLTQLYFDAMNFIRTTETYDDKYITYVERGGNDIRVKLFCLDPSKLLKVAMKRGKSSILYSATLSPIDYFRNILGGDEEDYRIIINSPFEEANLCLMIANNIKTQYNVREFSYIRVAQYINQVVEIKKGNYIVFFPSYKYLKEVYNAFCETCPTVETICQVGCMSEEAREVFLNNFSRLRDTTLVGFAVMGGAFGEGIDLTGDRLIGAIIVGVGLPQICLERDIIKDYFEGINNSGFEYAYTYPGMNKVLQAAGRVIRTERDKGVVFLIDERFSRNVYLKLMPKEWKNINWIKSEKDVDRAVRLFWDSSKE